MRIPVHSLERLTLKNLVHSVVAICKCATNHLVFPDVCFHACHALSSESRTKDNQKHELVGRILQEQDNEQWESLFASAALQRCKERTIRFVEMSGRETKLKVAPLERCLDESPQASLCCLHKLFDDHHD